MNMGHFHKKEPTGKSLLQRKAQWAGLSKNKQECDGNMEKSVI